MDEQLKIRNNTLSINNVNVEFKYNIRDVQVYRDLIIILLAIPFNETALDNLYAVTRSGKIAWRVQGLNEQFPDGHNLPYEQMNIKENKIMVTDFYGRRYFVNPLNGDIEKRDVIK